MGFLLRMTFWFSLVLLLLPLDPASSTGPKVGALQAFFAAREAVGDVAGICERKPAVCETGAAAFQTIKVRAREGARLAMSAMADDGAGPDRSMTTGSTAPVKPAAAK